MKITDDENFPYETRTGKHMFDTTLTPEQKKEIEALKDALKKPKMMNIKKQLMGVEL